VYQGTDLSVSSFSFDFAAMSQHDQDINNEESSSQHSEQCEWNNQASEVQIAPTQQGLALASSCENWVLLMLLKNHLWAYDSALKWVLLQDDPVTRTARVGEDNFIAGTCRQT